MFKKFVLATILLFLHCSQNPVDSTSDENDIVVGFNITGKVLDQNGNPVVGARASLVNSGLSDITDASGSYHIIGSSIAKRSSLRKISVDTSVIDTSITDSVDTDTTIIDTIDTDTTITDTIDTPIVVADSGVVDTIVITVPNGEESSDSSEVIREEVTSGVILELPTTYIVQREIRGYLSPDDVNSISQIEAIVYDVAFPDIQKHINLWHDTLNKAFHSFAYFSSSTGKEYVLYVNIYDTLNNFVGRSPNFNFTDQAGNIVFAEAFSWENAKPQITVEAPDTVLVSDTITFNITASDNFGGEIVSCRVQTDTGFIEIEQSLLKRTSGGSFTGAYTVVAPNNAGNFISNVEVEDNDGNVSISQVSVFVDTIRILKAGFFMASTYNNSDSITMDFYYSMFIDTFEFSIYSCKIIINDTFPILLNNNVANWKEISTNEFGNVNSWRFNLRHIESLPFEYNDSRIEFETSIGKLIVYEGYVVRDRSDYIIVKSEEPIVEPDSTDTIVEPDPIDTTIVEPDPIDTTIVEPDPTDTTIVEPEPVDTIVDPIDTTIVEPDPIDTILGYGFQITPLRKIW